MNQKKINFRWVIIVIALLAVLSGLTSCNLEKQATKYYALHPDKLAEKCAAAFPVQEKIIPGKPVITRDTVWEKPDSVPCPQGNGKPDKKIPCPPCKSTNTNTIQRDTVIIPDLAKITVLSNQLALLSKANHDQQLKLKDKDLEIKDLQAAKLKLKLMASGAGVLAALLAFFFLRGSFLSIIKKFIP